MFQVLKKHIQFLHSPLSTTQRIARRVLRDPVLSLWQEREATYSLSRYYPEGTQYFYAYPSGEDSQFYNVVPPEVEELVAARPLSRLGNHVDAIVFHNSLQPTSQKLLEQIGVSLIPNDRITFLPEEITTKVTGAARNHAIKKVLRTIARPGRLIMAQPFLDSALEHVYQIPSATTVWLNDKKNMPAYIPEEFLPERYATFDNGAAFAVTTEKLPLPSVVKITSSSSGDGVRICHTRQDLERAQRDFQASHMTITVDQYIKTTKNLGVQFGIPHHPDMPVEIVGVDEQITNPEGAFLGGFIDPHTSYDAMPTISEVLLATILPAIRERGWYGPGGFDVLLDDADRPYFVDANFRMTGMSNFLYAVANKEIDSPLLSFYGTFQGTEQAFFDAVLRHADASQRGQFVHLVSLMQRGDVWHFQGALVAQHVHELAYVAKKLVQAGVHSQALASIARTQPT